MIGLLPNVGVNDSFFVLSFEVTIKYLKKKKKNWPKIIYKSKVDFCFQAVVIQILWRTVPASLMPALLSGPGEVEAELQLAMACSFHFLGLPMKK